MANISDASGIMNFTHPTASPELLEKLVKHSQQEFEYGVLWGSDFEDIHNTAAWDTDFQFYTSGRWSLHSTMSNYFENFNDTDFKDQLEGMVIHIPEYTDYESGCSLFEEGTMKLTAVMNPSTRKLETILNEQTSSDIPFTAESLMDNDICETAWDTFTDVGIKSLWELLKTERDYLIQYPIVKYDGELQNLMNNLGTVTPDVLKKAISDSQVYDEVVDCEEFELVEEFFESNELFEHPLLAPYK